jgi:leucyl aminopeptidase
MHKYYNSCAFNYGYKKLLKSIDFNVNIDLISFLRFIPKKFIYSFLVIILANHELAYNLPFNLKTKKNSEITHNYIIGKIYISYIYQIENIIYGYNFARKLQLMPNNYLNPEKFAKIVVNEFKKYSGLVEVSVLNKSDIEKKKMGLILGVSQGSNDIDACKLLIIKPKNICPEFTVIGKGITFDTGGVNLKPPRAITDMQYDMSGAAIAVSLMLLFLKEKIKPNFNIVVPLAINNISENSIKVHDVLMSYASKSVEIIDTDAEGRLLLADAISYAIKDLNAKSIITVATLTGAISVGLGENYTGYWLNN